MVTAGVKDLKNKLSQYLSSVKLGEETIVTSCVTYAESMASIHRKKEK